MFSFKKDNICARQDNLNMIDCARSALSYKVCEKEKDEHQTKICCGDEIFLNLKGLHNYRRFISLKSICIGKENPTVDFQNIVTGDARRLSVSEEIVVYFVFSFLYLDKESQNTKVVHLLSTPYGHDKQRFGGR